MSATPAESGECAMQAPLAARIAAAGHDWIVPQWPAPPCVHALMTTRNGGVSMGAHASLDVGPSDMSTLDAASRTAILENRRRVQQTLPSAPVWLQQVHGSHVVVVDRPALREDSAAPRADASVTRAADIVLAVRVADCLPVLFSGDGGAVVGAAHAGWRGLASGVLEATVTAMACDPAGVVAWFGPAIGPAAFEVGDDVRDAFVGSDGSAGDAFAAHRPGKWLADLEALARGRLARAGVVWIGGGGMCTVSNPGRFFSFRRDRTTGRMAALVWRTAA
jgi:polyphenol oxidase